MLSNDFKHSTLAVSRTLSDTMNINVVFEGDEAKSDGKTIYLPAIPDNINLPSDVVHRLRGFVDKETSYIQYTKFKPIVDALKPLEDNPQARETS